MVIGNLGDLIVFEVSSEKIQTFNSLTRSVKGKWTTHDIISNKPKSEFLGADLSDISFAVTLSVNHGVKPRDTMERIEEAVEKGEHFPFVLGGRLIGENDWKITSVSETYSTIIADGKIAQAKVNLTLQEYV